ncbi:4'-phosphopantetheinyl transferase family protein [Sinorhizobium meliloti]|uniref:4'-phosphopantetheinyl transferase family protein n=1 Tax=Rhizobium meliloti TaxID=382 RepID=UPI0013E2BE68|nr:4'-phosphopantetheinyl transferase superfamily protein [Sinorhizobium meliloti]
MPDTVAAYASTLLGPDERAREQRYYRLSDQARFTAGRTALRLLLAAYANASPDALRFEFGPYGKPFLPEFRDISFSLSHTNDLIMVGLAREASIGVDVEWVVASPDYASLARLTLSKWERRWVAAQSQEGPMRAFYRAWVRKEAYLKMMGSGLVDDLKNVDCRLSGAQLMEVSIPGQRQKQTSVHRVSLHEACPAKGYVAALVTDQPGCSVNRWSFDPYAWDRHAYCLSDKRL